MTIQKMLVKAMFALPEMLRIRIAGGMPPEIDGRRLDARTHLLSALGARAPGFDTLPVPAARLAAREAFKLINPPRPGGVAVKDATMPGPGGDLPVRHYRPEGIEKTPLPGLVYFHMGGWVIGDIETSDFFCALISQTARAHVMSVDYRLAPEHAFPAATEDAIASFLWLRDNAKDLKVNPKRIGVAGDSAGGCMAAVVCQELKKRGAPQPKLQCMIYPATDLAWEGGSMESCADCYPLTRDMMEWFRAHWLKDKAQAQDPMASPLRAADFAGLAPAILTTAGFDVLRDQGEAYARKLQQAEVKTIYRCYDSLAHAFTANCEFVPAARDACAEIAQDIARGLAA